MKLFEPALFLFSLIFLFTAQTSHMQPFVHILLPAELKLFYCLGFIYIGQYFSILIDLTANSWERRMLTTKLRF
jgi:hypothetical protein